jgi:hypothetical protein
MNGNGNVEQLVREIELTRAEIRRKRASLKEAANPMHRLQRSWDRHSWPWLAGAAAVAALVVTAALRKRYAPKPYIPPGYVVVTRDPQPSSWLGILAKTAFAVSRPMLGLWIKQQWGRKGSPTPVP